MVTSPNPSSPFKSADMQTQTILDSVAALPRVRLARLNTPFEEMPRLRAAIAESMDAEIDAVPPLFIKRDDMTGFAFGGNKARHMEYLFAHFIERGIDAVVNINHYDSNNARLVAAAAAKTGMKYHWVAYDMVDEPVMGNMLVAHLTGAEIHRVPDMETARALAEEIRDEETAKGRTATIVSDNPFFDIAGMIGFLETAAELDAQIENFDSSPAGGGSKNLPSPVNGEGFRWGSQTPIRLWGLCGRSIAGIRLYARNTGKPWTATAVAQPHYTPENYEPMYIERSTRVADLLGLETTLQPGDIDTLTGYTITYGVPTQAGIAAMHLTAKTEGIILDPTYTGKSMSGLIAEIRASNVDPETPVVFIHSGGLPQTFAFADEIWGGGLHQ